MREEDYYNEIAVYIVKEIKANLDKPELFNVVPLIGEVSSGLRTLIANGYSAGALLQEFSRSVHRLHLDISILVENIEKGIFELIIFEIKKVEGLGLGELSQLIGYCLVSKRSFGILINIDKGLSKDFSVILDSDPDLTTIVRVLDNSKVKHELGVMIWNSDTKQMECVNSGSVPSISSLTEKLESILNS